ncbi:MAG: ABC transporter permease subunit [Clostridiales bacterium]|jgi:putative aldouronate transport system permease protein|nr:ABC transporter permease subunit [Clostridiales bacterium]
MVDSVFVRGKPSKEEKALMKQFKRKKLIKEIRRYRSLYPIMIFGVVFFIIFAYMPMYGIQLAFKDYTFGRGVSGSPWAGLAHFQRLFARQEFWSAFLNTFIISMIKLLGFPAPIILAILLNEITSRRYTKSMQVIYTLPHFLSWITIGGIMKRLLSSSGTINSLLASLGNSPVAFLSNGDIFRFLLLFTDMWKESGWSCIIYMAAIAGIDPTLYESATLDGANRLQRAWNITIPSIRTTISVLFILAIGGIMGGNFDQIFNLYNPTVYSKADIIPTYIYRITFEQAPNYGFSTAVGLFQGVINAAMLFGANFIVGKMDSDAKMI